jgi:hypothetical protein
LTLNYPSDHPRCRGGGPRPGTRDEGGWRGAFDLLRAILTPIYFAKNITHTLLHLAVFVNDKIKGQVS